MAENREIKTAAGDIYNGAHNEGRPHGHGKLVMASGNVFEGNFVEGQRQGKGKMVMTNG